MANRGGEGGGGQPWGRELNERRVSGFRGAGKGGGVGGAISERSEHTAAQDKVVKTMFWV